MIWLGESRGYLSDWIAQLWVRGTGRRMDLSRDPWLAGPVGRPRGIGTREATRSRPFRVAAAVFPAETRPVRADHVLTPWGATFLRLHYRMRAKAEMREVGVR
jgi:hypothetical protein